MECCERFAVLGFNLAWPSLLLCCLKDKSSPLFIFSCFKKQPVRQAGLGRLRGSLQFWHFNLRVIGARSGSQSVRDTLCFILQTSGPSPRLNLLAMKPNQRVIYKSLQSQLKCRDWNYGGGECQYSSGLLMTAIIWLVSAIISPGHHHSYHSDHQRCPESEQHQLTAFWLMSSDEWINLSDYWSEECVAE